MQVASSANFANFVVEENKSPRDMVHLVLVKSNTRRFFLPLAVVFFVFGVEISDYFETCRFHKILRVFRILSIVAMHCIMLPILIFNYFHMMLRIGRNDASNMAVYIADIMLAFITMATYEFYLLKQRAIRELLACLLELAHASLLKRHLVVHVVLLACCVLPFAPTPYGIISGETNLNTTRHNKESNVPILNNILWHYVWLSTFRPFTLLTCAFFLYICFVFTTTFRDLGTRELFPSVRKFIQRHQLLCCHLKRAESLFSSILFLACCSDVIATTFFLRSVSLGGNFVTWKLSLFPYAVLNFGLFVSRILAAAAVNSQVTESLQGMDYMVNRLIFGSDLNSFMTLTKLTCYTQRLSINPPALTGGGFFTMKRGCILTVGSAILTYILVLYQSL